MNATGKRAGRRVHEFLAIGVALGIASPAIAAIVIDSGYSPTTNEFWPSNANATFHLTAGGDVLVNLVDEGDWINPKTGMGNYQYRATYDGGCGQYNGSNFGGSALNAWTSLGGGAAWFVTASGQGDRQLCAIGIEIRETANPSVILGSSYIFFQAEVW